MTSLSEDTATARAARADATTRGRRRSLSRAIPWVSLVLLVAGGGAAWYRYSASERAPKIRYETAPLGSGPVSAKVTASGTLSALVTVLVGSQVSGRIDSIRVDYNSTVKKGQVIANIE